MARTGNVSARIDEELERQIDMLAKLRRTSVNALVEEALAMLLTVAPEAPAIRQLIATVGSPAHGNQGALVKEA